MFRWAVFKVCSAALELVKTVWLSFFSRKTCFVVDGEAAIFTHPVAMVAMATMA